MTGCALHTNEILQRCMKGLVLNKIIIAFTVKTLFKFVFISTWISLINMCICNVLCVIYTFLFQYTLYTKGPHNKS